MPASLRKFSVTNHEEKIATAYNQAGGRYARYADGDGRNLFDFEGRHGFADRSTWELIDAKLLALRAQGLCHLRILDLGCGPGTWLRRAVVRARQLGFARIDALGLDIADAQLESARVLAQPLESMEGVAIAFRRGDLRGRLVAEPADICLCLYGVLNHMPVSEMPDILRRIAALTQGFFIATVRTIGSTPTVYVDEVSAATRFYQDNRIDRLDVEFSNGRRTSFQSHLFSRAELVRIAGTAFAVEEVRGLDIFHGRFAADPRWNPSKAAPLVRLSQELARLEDRYCRDPGFMDHATHLLLSARPRKPSL